MAVNWVRDVHFVTGVEDVRGFVPEMWLMTYHMLRCAGYKWIWECDGHKNIVGTTVPNHVSDGNMEAAGVADWVAAGAPLPTVSKSTSVHYSGEHSLEITGQVGGEVQSTAIVDPPHTKSTTGSFTALGGGVMRFWNNSTQRPPFTTKDIGRNVTFVGSAVAANDGTFVITGVLSEETIEYTNLVGVTSAPNNGLSWWVDTPIHLALWVNNPGSQTWNVDVDRGDGSPVTVGSFSGTTGWEIKHFDFYMQSTGSVQIFIRPQGTIETIHIDGILMFRSFFEFTNDYEDYADGDAGAYVAQFASDEFESSNYTFTAGDIGKFVFIFDQSGNYPKNTGCYMITGANVGRAVLDVRSLSAALSSQDGSVDPLSWRMVDIHKWAASAGSYSSSQKRAVEVYNGFGLESPHTSKWRFVCRGLWADGDASNNNGSIQWSAPQDTELDVDSGNFFINSGPSITGFGAERNRTIQDMNLVSVADIYDGYYYNWFRGHGGHVIFGTRNFMIFDEGGAWFFVCTFPEGGNYPAAALYGIVGEDQYHPGMEAHCHLSCKEGSMAYGGVDDFMSYTSSRRWWFHGKGISKDGSPTRIGCGQLGISTGNVYVWEMTNAQANPFSGEEWLQPVLILRGSDLACGGYSEREAEHLYQGRANMSPLSVFGHDKGQGDSFSLTGTTITLTDAAGAFTADMVGKEITITGSTTPGNDGTFDVTSVPTPNTLTYENAGGATEAFAGNWTVNMARYLHILNGFCIDWMGERLSS